jgi:phosphoglycolate phosphatase-like HAD superfamily hydrolase
MIKTIIFDFDGVICDTFSFHRHKVGEFTGNLLSEDEYRDIHNGNFFHNEHKELANVDWQKYRDFIYKDQSQLIITDEVKETIRELSNSYDLFIVTSGGKKNISDILTNNGMGGIFKEILGLESHRSKVDKFNFIFDHYSISPADCIFVTDTLGDIVEANQLHIKTIAVDFGFHPKETLEKGKPLKIISNLLSANFL